MSDLSNQNKPRWYDRVRFDNHYEKVGVFEVFYRLNIQKDPLKHLEKVAATWMFDIYKFFDFFNEKYYFIALRNHDNALFEGNKIWRSYEHLILYCREMQRLISEGKQMLFFDLKTLERAPHIYYVDPNSKIEDRIEKLKILLSKYPKELVHVFDADRRRLENPRFIAKSKRFRRRTKNYRLKQKMKKKILEEQQRIAVEASVKDFN